MPEVRRLFDCQLDDGDKLVIISNCGDYDTDSGSVVTFGSIKPGTGDLADEVGYAATLSLTQLKELHAFLGDEIRKEEDCL